MDTNVPVNTDIRWNAVSNATSYFLVVCHSSGTADFADTLDLGLVTSYSLEVNQSWAGNLNGRPFASDSYWYRINTVDGRSISGYSLL
jgi:hypothetical protein